MVSVGRNIYIFYFISNSYSVDLAARSSLSTYLPEVIRTEGYLLNIVACRAVSRQRLGEHVPATTDRHVCCWKLGFLRWPVPMSYMEDNWGNEVSSAPESEGSRRSERA
jgi:hypothetical protein